MMRGSAVYRNYYKENDNTIRVMTYEEWEEAREAADYMINRKKKRDKKRLELYYKQQRILGLQICSIAVIFILIGHITDITTLMFFGDMFAFFGLYTMFTHKMLLVNSYFFEKRKEK